MPTQRHPHVIDFHRDGIAAEEAFVKQFEPGALHKAQLEKSTFQLPCMFLLVLGITDPDDDAAITLLGSAELENMGHEVHERRRGTPRLLTLIIRCDHPASSKTCRRIPLPMATVGVSPDGNTGVSHEPPFDDRGPCSAGPDRLRRE